MRNISTVNDTRIIKTFDIFSFHFEQKAGLVRGSNPGPLAPKARIIPLDQRATSLTTSNLVYDFIW